MSHPTQLGDDTDQREEPSGLLPRLPVQLTSFVGREGALAEIGRLFGNARLVTLTGPGGCGKTRLALQATPLLARSLSCEAAWVDLASLADPALIPQSIARALNVVDASDRPTLDAVIAHLVRRRLFIVLDNAEHLIDVVARIAEQILVTCHQVLVLVTSREALNIPGETSWTVPPLSLPARVEGDVSSLQDYEAVRLFVDRARTAVPEFTLTQRNAPYIVEICQRLDGMPLAIELAASRMHVLGAEEIAVRLEQCFKVLTAGRRTALPRHQTLQATIDWSYDLLSAAERRLFMRLSVFAGGFTLDAAEAVCAGDELDTAEILHLLANLNDKSLVTVGQRTMTTRYRLLETIRQYAQEKLAASGAQPAMRERHREWCAQLAESGSELEEPGQVELVDRFDAEHDNFRSAMQSAIESDDGRSLGRIAGSLWRFWLMRGYLREGFQWLTEASSRLPTDSPERISPLLGAAVLMCHQADYPRSTALFNEARAICQRNRDRNGEGEVLYGLATVAQFQGRYAEATQHFEETLSLLDHTRGRALSLMGLAMTLLYLGQIDRAAEMCEQSLVLCREVGDERSIGGALTSLGIISLARGDQSRAEEVCRQSLELRRTVGDLGGVAHTLTVLGSISLERGDDKAALTRYQEALLLRREMGDAGGIAAPLEGLAAVASVRGEFERAVPLFGAAEAYRSRLDTPLSPIEQAFRDRYSSIARDGIAPARFDELWIAGRQTDPESVVQAALSIPSLTGQPQLTVDDEVHGDGSSRSPEPATASDLDIYAFGTTRIIRQGHEIEPAEWTYTKARELLLYLLCMGQSTKEQIGLALWPDVSETQLRSAFHTTLHHLRRALGDPAWILFRNGKYSFNRSRSFRYDVGQFEQELSRAGHLVSSDRLAAIELLNRAVARHHGKYLADLPDAEWHLAKQDDLARAHLNALLLLGDLLIVEKRYAQAARAYRSAIAAEPFFESAHRGLMQCYALQGERGQALRHYRELTDMLSGELDAQPDAKTRELFEQLRRENIPA